MRKNITKKEIIRFRNDIKNLFSEAKKISSEGMTLKYRENYLEYSRILVCPVKKFGHSVKRNKIRRQIKEIYRINKENIKRGFDFVFIVYPGRYEYEEREKQFREILKKKNFFLTEN